MRSMASAAEMSRLRAVVKDCVLSLTPPSASSSINVPRQTQKTTCSTQNREGLNEICDEINEYNVGRFVNLGHDVIRKLELAL